MQDKVIIVIIISTIAALLLLIVVLFLWSIIRRVSNERKYRTLDYLRALYDKKLRASLEAGDLPRTQSEFIAPPKSNAWMAIEDILLVLINEDEYQDEIIKLFSLLGYISFYENQMKNRDVSIRALCIDKLGKMKSEASAPKLIPLLDEEDPEIVAVAVRSLSKIGGREGLQAIVVRLDGMLARSIVSSKALGMALQAFGADAIPYLVEQKAGRDNPWIVSSILEILSRLPADPRSAHLAAEHLSSTNSEVRSKALKVFGRAENVHAVQNLRELILPLLRDPVWYVRLQAIRSIRALGYEDAAAPIGKLIFDQNWQVRNEAAQALIMLGERSLGIFLDVLTGADRYAKDSVCEEIEKTNFSARLIENLKGSDQRLQEKSRRILEIMHSLGFSTPLDGYLERGGDEAVKELLRKMKKAGSGA